jgi:hypothetical protein
MYDDEDTECEHEGIECEHNTGEDACHCQCDECTAWEDDDDA